MKKYGLIGKTLGHSFSKNYFAEKFALEGIDAVYSNYELPSIDLFPSVVADKDIVGLNVTIPYKQDVIPFLDDLSDEARAIGAVNVVRVIRNEASGEGKPYLKGYNTDVIGFMNSIRPLLKEHHQKALVLGTGGASKAIVYGLKRLGIEPQLVSRSAREGVISYSDLNEQMLREYKVIVNCTPLGTFPKVDECAPIPYEYITREHLLFDLVYNPDETLFLKNGKDRGATTKNGLEMLHLQAIAAWEIWTDNNSTISK